MNFWQATSQGIVWVTETPPQEVGGTKLGCRRAEENWRDQVHKRRGTFWGRLREEVKQKRECGRAVPEGLVLETGAWWEKLASKKNMLHFSNWNWTLTQLRQKNWCRERDGESWDNTEAEPFWTWRSDRAPVHCSQPLDKGKTPGVK